MRRSPAALALALTASAALALPASAGGSTSGSYRVRVLPDPTVDAALDGPCGVVDGWVLVTDVGSSYRSFRVPAGKTLTVRITPDAQVFAGDEGMVWRLKLRVGGRDVARSAGPAWRTEARYRAPKAQDVSVLACNRTAWPEATLDYTVR